MGGVSEIVLLVHRRLVLGLRHAAGITQHVPRCTRNEQTTGDAQIVDSNSEETQDGVSQEQRDQKDQKGVDRSLEKRCGGEKPAYRPASWHRTSAHDRRD